MIKINNLYFVGFFWKANFLSKAIEHCPVKREILKKNLVLSVHVKLMTSRKNYAYDIALQLMQRIATLSHYPNHETYDIIGYIHYCVVTLHIYA